MSSITYSSLEQAVRAAWRQWGHGYALHTSCTSCGEMRYCRGKLRAFVVCVDCFDARQS